MTSNTPDPSSWPVRPALPTSPPRPDDPAFPPAEQALAREIGLQREKDPFAGANTGADLFHDNLVKILQKDPDGVHAELLVAVPAALAGFACQAATWESLVVGVGHPVYSVFTVTKAADGALYPFADPMNQLLLEDPYSVWSLVTAAAHAADEPLPDVEEAVQHVSRTIGTPEFAVPRLPAGLSLGHDPLPALLEASWRRFLPLLGLTCVMPEEWPVLFALATQRGIDAVQDVIEPTAACRIALECALPMTHLPMATG